MLIRIPWLLGRLFCEKDYPTPRFAFQSCVNWMRALAIQANPASFTHQTCAAFYDSIARRAVSTEKDTLAFECLVMSAHHTAATRSLAVIPGNKYNECRAGIVSWYYAVYYSAKAMIAAASGDDPQTHAKTARIWQADIISHNYAMCPFNLTVTDLTSHSVDTAIDRFRNGIAHDVNTRPTTEDQAHGALCAYLKGTCAYRQGEVEKGVRNAREFKALGKKDFRTKAARELRDTALRRESVNFLVQASRYRGKANYRDAIYLSYGDDNSAILATFNNDLGIVATAFSMMAAHFVSRRVEAGTWTMFADDLHTLARFDLPYDFRCI